jgi:acyl dehydratase
MLRGLSGSGWQLCSLMLRMLGDGVITRAGSDGSRGVDVVRWLSPLRPGDDLMLDVDVLEARSSKSRPALGIVKFKCTVRNAKGETLAEMTSPILIKRREGAA